MFLYFVSVSSFWTFFNSFLTFEAKKLEILAKYKVFMVVYRIEYLKLEHYFENPINENAIAYL